MKPEFSGQIFEKHSNVKFNENPSSESRVGPCGRTVMKLTVTLCNFAKSCSNQYWHVYRKPKYCHICWWRFKISDRTSK